MKVEVFQSFNHVLQTPYRHEVNGLVNEQVDYYFQLRQVQAFEHDKQLVVNEVLLLDEPHVPAWELGQLLGGN